MRYGTCLGLLVVGLLGGGTWAFAGKDNRAESTYTELLEDHRQNQLNPLWDPNDLARPIPDLRYAYYEKTERFSRAAGLTSRDSGAPVIRDGQE